MYARLLMPLLCGALGCCLLGGSTGVLVLGVSVDVGSTEAFFGEGCSSGVVGEGRCRLELGVAGAAAKEAVFVCDKCLFQRRADVCLGRIRWKLTVSCCRSFWFL